MSGVHGTNQNLHMTPVSSTSSVESPTLSRSGSTASAVSAKGVVGAQRREGLKEGGLEEAATPKGGSIISKLSDMGRRFSEMSGANKAKTILGGALFGIGAVAGAPFFALGAVIGLAIAVGYNATHGMTQQEADERRDLAPGIGALVGGTIASVLVVLGAEALRSAGWNAILTDPPKSTDS